MSDVCAEQYCLRPVKGKGLVCVPCQKGMPALTNPKSPYAQGKPKGSATTGKTATTRKPKSQIKPQQPQKTQKTPTVTVTEKQQKQAVKEIFTCYWYGWENGIPPIFKDIFSKFGTFISDRATPSTMIGTPDTHRSSINIAGNKSFILVKEAIYPMEGEAAAFRAINKSPIMLEALQDVTPTDAIEMVKNDGQTYTFQKDSTDGSQYRYEDGQGVERKIPRWAIA
tara:strand:+ start:2672 stop:3346 length:675 start_codon:yes stop_codon:yes gene_type:complete